MAEIDKQLTEDELASINSMVQFGMTRERAISNINGLRKASKISHCTEDPLEYEQQKAKRTAARTRGEAAV